MKRGWVLGVCGGAPVVSADADPLDAAALGPAAIEATALLFPGQPPLRVKASARLPLHLALGIACCRPVCSGGGATPG